MSNINDKFELFMRDPIECIKELWANPAYLDHLTFAPEHRFADKRKTERVYDELMSGDWCWQKQVCVFIFFLWRHVQVHQELLTDGATLVPVILSSDKTQLCQFRGDKTAYPVYLTIGNISKSIRRKPSFRAQKLIGYLPTVSLDGMDLSADAARLARAQLFHYAMRIVTRSLGTAFPNGIELISGDGAVRLGFPVIAAYAADYPEQALVTCTRYLQTCPKCFVTKDELGKHVTRKPRHQEESIRTIRHASQQSTRARADAVLKDHSLNLIPDAFWIGLPYCDIHKSITPDVLHQIYQGLVRHLCGWLRTLIGDAELDSRFKRMPRVHGVRLFSNGISSLTQISGSEHREICKQVLGCIIDAPGVPAGVIRATRSLLDFLEIAQYQSHTEATLGYLSDALDRFHANKNVFINLGARANDDFNLEKLHSLEHYVDSIRLFGTTDNYNTEASERLHIDYAKDAYRATNKKDSDFLENMTRWLERREKMAAFDLVLQWRHGKTPKPRCRHQWQRPQLPGVYLAKNPSARAVPFHILQDQDQFGAIHFKSSLEDFISRRLQATHRCRATVSCNVHVLRGLEAVDVWYRVKFSVPNLQIDTEQTVLHTAHAEPRRSRGRGTGELDARFDTVLINDFEHNGEETGIEGVSL